MRLIGAIFLSAMPAWAATPYDTLPRELFPKPRVVWSYTADVFTVDASAPPVALLVVGADGRRAGVDPTKPLDEHGRGTTLNELDVAEVEQQIIDNDEPGSAPGPIGAAGWFVSIEDRPPHLYEVQARGVGTAVTSIGVTLPPNSVPMTPGVPQHCPHIVMKIMVAEAIVKRFQVTIDSVAHTVRADRLVQPGELAQSVSLSCTLAQIAPGGVCESLAAKARAAADAFARGNKRAARGLLQAFLKELKAQGGKHVQEPALTILREEAEALLNPPPPMPKPNKAKPVK